MSTIRKAKFKESEIIADFQILMAKETEDLNLSKETIIAGIEAVFEDKGAEVVTLNRNAFLIGRGIGKAAAV